MQVASPQPSSQSGWLFHVGARNVLATCWESRVADGKIIGFRTRLLETEGRTAKFALRSARLVAAARKTDYLGQTLSELNVREDAIHVTMTPYEWTQIEAEFS
jgi:hypothetical protein